MATSTRLRAEGKADQIKGKARELAGRVTGKKTTRAQGKAQDLKGKVKDTAGRAAPKR